MERRSCSNLHFINAIKGNLVSKFRNVDAYGKPALVFKAVKDIMEAADAKRLQPSTSQGAQCSDSRFSCARVKTESLCLPQVDRSLQEIDSRENVFVSHGGHDETGSDSDDDNFGQLTLKQLKEKFRTKKRKHVNSVDFKKYSRLEAEEDDSDLTEPLISLKLKLPKAKKKRVQAASQPPKCGTLIKSEQNPDSEMQFHRDLPLLAHVKTEAPEPMSNDSQLITPPVDDSPSFNRTNESNTEEAISGGAPETVECQRSKPTLFAEQHETCRVNEVSYDHLENVEPISPLLSNCEYLMDVDGQEGSCQQFLDLPLSESETEETEMQPLLIPFPSKDDNSRTNSFSTSFTHMNEFVEQMNCCHAVPVSDLVVDGHISDKEFCQCSDALVFSDNAKKDFASDHVTNATSSPATCLSTDDDLFCGNTEQKQALPCGSPNEATNSSEPLNHLVSCEDKSILDEHRQNTKSVLIDDEKQERSPASENQNCDIDETTSTSVPVQPPERLLLTRKVISPNSQERLCLVMSSSESYTNQISKENPCVSKQTDNKDSSLESDVKHDMAGNPKESGIVKRTKVIVSPTRTQKRSKNERRNSPPKGNLEGPRLCRSLPGVSTGCTSPQGCSESAIAFSQRQMQDIESLAVKLMSELKNMKEIVEQKLLFEAYRSVSIRNDADEVKDAITNATKVEETAKKWLSMMARDCNRFCKIMSLTQKGTAPATSDNEIRREKKKITFADEAGGTLCHVKVLEDEMTLESNSELQKAQTI